MVNFISAQRDFEFRMGGLEKVWVDARAFGQLPAPVADLLSQKATGLG